MLPKGHISVILGPRQTPSEYERSPQSPWEIIEVESVPAPVNDPFALDRLGKQLPAIKKVPMFRKKEFKLMDKSDLKKEKPGKDRKAKKHPFPPSLKRGSIIWDYGATATYLTAQAAFDAALLYWGTDVIDSNQFIRGQAGNYDTPFLWVPMVNFKELKTDGRAGHFLIFDAEDGAEVNWRTAYYGAIGANTSGGLEDAVQHVRFEGLNLFLDAGINGILSQVNSGTPDLIERMEFIDMKIERASYGGGIALTLPGVLQPLVDRCRLLKFTYGGPLGLGLNNESNIFITIRSSIIDAQESAIFFDNASGYIQGGIFAASLFKGKYGIYYAGSTQTIWHKTNCIFKATDYGVYLPNIPGFSALDTESDGNFYDCGLSPYADKNGPISLEEARTILFSIEDHSLEGDLTLDDDYKATPYPDSPVYRNGVVIGYQDIDKQLISKTLIDIGPYQVTKGYPYNPQLCGYCSPQDVISATGVEPTDLDQTTANDLDGLLCQWIADVSSIIDGYCETSWNIGSQPSGVTRVAISMMSDLVAMAVQRRKSPFVQLGEFTVKQVQDDLLSQSHKDILDLFRRKRDTETEFGMGVLVIEDLENE